MNSIFPTKLLRYLINAYFLPKEDFDSKDAAHLDNLCFKYSITKERFFERIYESSAVSVDHYIFGFIWYSDISFVCIADC